MRRFCAKRMLIAFPKLLHDIYLSEEYYGENVLHMGCVAEVGTVGTLEVSKPTEILAQDASLVKWLLDIGADFHRWAGRCSQRLLFTTLDCLQEVLWKFLLLR